MPALFDSRHTAYRTPFGAVTEGTEVFFRICLPRCWGCHAAQLVMQPDGQHPQFNGMFWAGMAGDDNEWWDVRYTPSTPGIYWYAFRLELAMGTGWLVRQPDGTAVYSCENSTPRWQLTCYAADLTTPDWLAGGVMYQIFPDRFAASGTPKTDVPTDRLLHTDWRDMPQWRPDENGQVHNRDYFGGDLAGITQKLDYLQSLGVTCVYLNPIFESHSNHRYDTADYTRVDPLLGDETALRTLTQEARARGIRLILDGVFSHTGSDSRYFNREGRYPTEGAYNSLSSPYAGWYRFRHWPRDYQSWWGFETLPEVDELSASFMQYINGEDGIVARWLRCGTAGWRLDVADELPDGFLDALRTRVKATDPDAVIIGEVWEDASNKESYGHRRRYLLGQQLDSVMNYPFRQAILLFIVQGGRREFWNRVLAVVENYPPPVLRLLMNHIGTHDTERALTVLGGEPSRQRGRSWQAQQCMTAEQRALGLERLRAATLLQYALPGVPSVYYGDEAGMEGYADPFNRCAYPWGEEDASLVDWYRRLGACRHACAALTDGDILPLDSNDDIVAFIRRGNGYSLLCAVNSSDRVRTLLLPPAFMDGALVMGEACRDGNVLYLPARSGVWMRPNGE